MPGTVNNEVTHTATFLDANGDPVAPDSLEDDEDVIWTLSYSPALVPFLTTIQPRSAAVSTGVFELQYTPTVARAYYVKASATVGGAVQSTPYELYEVEP